MRLQEVCQRSLIEDAGIDNATPTLARTAVYYSAQTAWLDIHDDTVLVSGSVSRSIRTSEQSPSRVTRPERSGHPSPAPPIHRCPRDHQPSLTSTVSLYSPTPHSLIVACGSLLSSAISSLLSHTFCIRSTFQKNRLTFVTS